MRATDKHHLLNGWRRSKAEKYKLYVYLCRSCHNKVHFGSDSRELMDRLRKYAQRLFITNYPNLDFFQEFKINYLDEDEKIEGLDLEKAD